MRRLNISTFHPPPLTPSTPDPPPCTTHLSTPFQHTARRAAHLRAGVADRRAACSCARHVVSARRNIAAHLHGGGAAFRPHAFPSHTQPAFSTARIFQCLSNSLQCANSWHSTIGFRAVACTVSFQGYRFCC